LTAENKVYERVNSSTDFDAMPDDDVNNDNTGGGNNGNPGGDFVG
jgi:hypothetical protein